MRSITVLGLLGTLSSMWLAACGGGSTCEDAVANAAKLYGFAGEGYGGIRGKALTQCKDEKWSDKLRSCAAGAKTKGELDACKPAEEEAAAPRGKKSEAEVNLEAIKKGLKVHYIENAIFPTGTAEPTPGPGCCEGPNHKCPVSADAWMKNPIWSTLDFEVLEPHHFQYSYESTDGKVAIARAVGDLDCDATTITYELRCEAPEGNPSCTVTKPERAD